MSWAEYTEAARELAELRRRDAAVHADRTARSRTASKDLEKLDQHLAAQRETLTAIARTLRLPAPYFGVPQRSSITDLAAALHQAADTAHTADVEARRAENAGTRPVILPDLAPTGRNVLIYSTWALVGWLLQCGLFTFSPETSFSVAVWSLCGLPALAFFAGYATVATLGQPRVGEPLPKQARLGGAICFVGMPVAWIGLVAAFTVLRG